MALRKSESGLLTLSARLSPWVFISLYASWISPDEQADEKAVGSNY